MYNISSTGPHFENGLLPKTDEIISISVIAFLEGLNTWFIALHVLQVAQLLSIILETHDYCFSAGRQQSKEGMIVNEDDSRLELGSEDLNRIKDVQEGATKTDKTCRESERCTAKLGQHCKAP
jgi:hypothetical protein